MKNKKIKVFIPIIIIIVILLAIVLLIINMKNSTKRTEKREDYIGKVQKINDLTFENTSLKYENGISIFETNVTNIGNDTKYLTEVKIHIKNKKGKDIIILTGFAGDNIKSGESKIITSTYGQKLNDAYSVEYEIIK